MIAEETSLVNQTRAFAESQLAQVSHDFTYHNLAHTQAVVGFADEIADYEGLNRLDHETVLMAAWLHDVGYRQGCDQHEAVGAGMARSFLTEHGLPDDRVEEVVRCIEATKMPQCPQGNRLAEILCDADLGHLSADDFPERSELLRQEFKRTGLKMTKVKWLEKTAVFLSQHHYFTQYGREVLAPRKAANLVRLQKQLAELQVDGSGTNKARPGEHTAETDANKARLRRPDRVLKQCLD